MLHSLEPQKDVFDLSEEYYGSESHKQMRQIRLHESQSVILDFEES